LKIFVRLALLEPRLGKKIVELLLTILGDLEHLWAMLENMDALNNSLNDEDSKKFVEMGISFNYGAFMAMKEEEKNANSLGH